MTVQELAPLAEAEADVNTISSLDPLAVDDSSSHRPLPDAMDTEDDLMSSRMTEDGLIKRPRSSRVNGAHDSSAVV